MQTRPRAQGQLREWYANAPSARWQIEDFRTRDVTDCHSAVALRGFADMRASNSAVYAVYRS